MPPCPKDLSTGCLLPHPCGFLLLHSCPHVALQDGTSIGARASIHLHPVLRPAELFLSAQPQHHAQYWP